VRPGCLVIAEVRPRRLFIPFFLASLGLMLTLGATLGALNLLRLTGTWGPLPRPSVWAHGYAQIFGFLALFVMGFAYHAVPRFVGSPLYLPALIAWSLWLQVGGVSAVAAAFLASPAVVRPLWVAGTAALVAAALVFGTVLVGTLRGGRPAPFGRWMVAGAFWLAFASGLGLAAAVEDDLAWHHPLWPAALYGFAGSWILGAGRRLFPISLGFKPRWPRLEWPAFLAYQLGVAAWSLGAWPLGTEWRPVRALGALALLAATPLYAAAIGLGGPRFDWARAGVDALYERYVRSAWFWLFVGLATGPGWTLGALARGDYGSLTMLDFSRHTVALGFATQMIVAIGSRFVPAFTGKPLWSPRAHRLAFWLLNLSVAWRGLEAVIATGHAAEAWPLLGLAGPPAVIALALFGLNLVMTLRADSPLRGLRRLRDA
jgi:hypothetical protein